MTHSSWRAAALDVITRAAFEVFRRMPMMSRRLVTRLLTPNYTLGAVALCRDRRGRVLLVRSRQHAGWGLPGGLVRRGEEPVDGLVREIAEELGLDVDLADVADQPTVILVDSAAQQVTVVIAVTLPGEPEVDGAEVMQAGWFAPEDLPPLLVRGTAESLAAMGVRSARAV